METAKALEDFFLEASAVGWAAGNDGYPSPFVHGYQEIIISLPRYPTLLYTNRWGKHPKTGLPDGNTVISERVSEGLSIPRWVMWYGGGKYEKAAIPFLRASLMKSCKAGKFTGGRGPHEVDEAEFQYFNNWEGDFTGFSGFEKVWGVKANRALGEHEYGGRLIQP